LRASTLATRLDDWLTSKEQVSAATRLAYEQTVREFKAFLGEQGCRRRLESITEADIRGFVALLRSEGRSAGTINKLVRKYLSVPFEKARKLGKIKFNPVMLLDPEKVESVARHTFTPDQVASLVAVANRDWSGAILLAYGTGARLQDIANLKWTALDLETGVVTFTERKTGRKAVIGLHADFVDWTLHSQSQIRRTASFSRRWPIVVVLAATVSQKRLNRSWTELESRQS
jgi:site-specific recombinase XerD